MPGPMPNTAVPSAFWWVVAIPKIGASYASSPLAPTRLCVTNPANVLPRAMMVESGCAGDDRNQKINRDIIRSNRRQVRVVPAHNPTPGVVAEINETALIIAKGAENICEPDRGVGRKTLL